MRVPVVRPLDLGQRLSSVGCQTLRQAGGSLRAFSPGGESVGLLIHHLSPDQLTRLKVSASDHNLEVSVLPGGPLLIGGSRGSFLALAQSLSRWDADLSARILSRSRLRPPPTAWRLPSGLLPWGKPRVQAILNVTPDSFFDGGRYQALDAALARAEQAITEGADLLDVGGESTRPGADRVSVEEELRRVLPVVEALAKRYTIPVSIDTSRAEVARQALAAGAQVVNDISGLTFDPDMASVVASQGAGLILMHTRGEPRSMQQHTAYSSLVGEVLDVLERQALLAEAAGVRPDSLVLDPGIGFAKSPEGNLTLLRELPALASLGYPILVGASRKSFLGKMLGYAPEDRLEGSLAAAVAAVMAGAQLVRVHDVLATRRAVDTAAAIRDADLGDQGLQEQDLEEQEASAC